MTKASIYKRCVPLFFHSERLVVYRNNAVYYFSDNNELELIFRFKLDLLSLFSRISNSFTRLLRSDVFSACSFDDAMYFSYRKKIFEYSSFGSLKELSQFSSSNGPLNYTCVNNINDFEDGVYFGDYFNNKSKNKVNLYKIDRRNSSNLTPVYTFEQGVANHIHNMISDDVNNCIWILLGDFGSSASIWKSTKNFSHVEKIVSGKQQYRACVAFPWSGGLLYATDSQFEKNSIRFLHYEDSIWSSKKIYDLNGSSIYGMELKDYFVFSTSTEPGEVKKNIALTLLDNKNGPGILKRQSDIIICRKKDLKCTVLFSIEKDYLPYRLFQFGTIKFPKGKANNNKIYAYSIGSKQHDLSMFVFDLDNL